VGVGPDSRRAGLECQQSRGSAPPVLPAPHPARSCATARAPVRCKPKPRARGSWAPAFAYNNWSFKSQRGRLTMTGRVRLSSAGVAAGRTSFGAGPQRSESSGTSLLTGCLTSTPRPYLGEECTGCAQHRPSLHLLRGANIEYCWTKSSLTLVPPPQLLRPTQRPRRPRKRLGRARILGRAAGAAVCHI
jgi:hypothetical protein